MSAALEVLVLPGDGIGPEVIDAAVVTMRTAASRHAIPLALEWGEIGAVALDRGRAPLPPETLARARACDAVLLGAVGDPRFDDAPPDQRPEAGLLALRRQLGVFANVRPLRTDLAPERSPLRPEVAAGVDLVFVRELTGGIYFGSPRGVSVDDDGERVAVDTMRYGAPEIRRVARFAFELARRRRRRVCSVDKANVLSCSALWREVVREVHRDFPDVALEHRLVDAFAMVLVATPRDFDVVLTENMFGDILTDEAAALAGSLGLLPSASFGERRARTGRAGLYEPIHGSAPGLAGRDVADPVGAILSAAWLLDELAPERGAGRAIETAVRAAITDGWRTADLRSPHDRAVGTRAFADEVARRIGEAP